jgi:cobalt/nickel transport system permease protein
MHLHALDAYRPRASFIHRLDARVKLVLTLLFIVATALTPDRAWLAYVLLTGLALGVTVASRLGVGFVQRRAAVALPFALAALTVMFSTPGRSLLTMQVLGWDAALTDAGLIRFASIVLKSWLSVQMAVMLTASTPFPALLQAMRSLRVPKVMVATLGFTYRYAFVIGDEALRMRRARAARSGALSGSAELAEVPSKREGTDGGGGGALSLSKRGGIFWRARVTGGMVGSLFLRSIERSERIYDAMMSRGYDGEVRTLRPPVLHSGDVLVALPFVLLLAAIQVLARLP